MRHREPHTTPLAALRSHFLDGLQRRDPVTGLNDTPEVVAFHNLLYSTPTLIARLSSYMRRAETALGASLAETCGEEETIAMVAAAQIFGAQRVLADGNAHEMRAGKRADDVYPDAVRHATMTFELIENGFSDRFDKTPLQQRKAIEKG